MGEVEAPIGPSKQEANSVGHLSAQSEVIIILTFLVLLSMS